MRRAAAEKEAELDRLGSFRDEVKPPRWEHGQVERRRKRKPAPPVADVPTGGRTRPG